MVRPVFPQGKTYLKREVGGFRKLLIHFSLLLITYNLPRGGLPYSDSREKTTSPAVQDNPSVPAGQLPLHKGASIARQSNLYISTT